jgi:hypothetical protein
VRQSGAPVEIEKPGTERGTYQNPGLYSAPPETALTYVPEPTASGGAAAEQVEPDRR